MADPTLTPDSYMAGLTPDAYMAAQTRQPRFAKNGMNAPPEPETPGGNFMEGLTSHILSPGFMAELGMAGMPALPELGAFAEPGVQALKGPLSRFVTGARAAIPAAWNELENRFSPIEHPLSTISAIPRAIRAGSQAASDALTANIPVMDFPNAGLVGKQLRQYGGPAQPDLRAFPTRTGATRTDLPDLQSTESEPEVPIVEFPKAGLVGKQLKKFGGPNEPNLRAYPASPKGVRTDLPDLAGTVPASEIPVMDFPNRGLVKKQLLKFGGENVPDLRAFPTRGPVRAASAPAAQAPVNPVQPGLPEIKVTPTQGEPMPTTQIMQPASKPGFEGESLTIPKHYAEHKNPSAAFALDKDVVGWLRSKNVSPDSLTPNVLQQARQAIGKSAIKDADVPAVLSRVRQTMKILP